MEENKYTPEALSCLPQEELRQILAAELSKPAPEIDDGFVRLLLAQLQSRGIDPEFTDDEAVEAACERFRKDTEISQKPSRKRGNQIWAVKAASVVLVLSLLFFGLPATTQANNIQKILTWWTDSAFRFFAPGKQVSTQTHIYQTDHPGLQQVYDAVTELGITEPIVPSWIPEGFELIESKTIPMPEDTLVDSLFESENQSILITFIVHNEEATFQHEKDSEHVVVHETAGRKHYILSNLETQIITWVANNIECTIITDCLEEDVYRMITSIYTSED